MAGRLSLRVQYQRLASLQPTWSAIPANLLQSTSTAQQRWGQQRRKGGENKREARLSDLDRAKQAANLGMRETARAISDELGKVQDFAEEDKNSLARQVGHGALKYFLLKVAPAKSMMFDPKSSIDFFGNTAPFIQFNVVRCKSILRQLGINPADIHWDADTPLDAQERSIAWGILSFPEVVKEAAVHPCLHRYKSIRSEALAILHPKVGVVVKAVRREVCEIALVAGHLRGGYFNQFGF